ncbi:MAG: enoyl-[acyl-carrier protein] reductase I [Myxococcota bacterium]
MSPRRGLVVGVSGPDSVGWACARALRDAGAVVTMTCRPARLARCADLAAAEGLAVLPLDADDPASVDAAFADLDHLDFLLHCIVHAPPGALKRPLTALTRAEFDATMGAGVHSLIAVCSRAAPLLATSEAPRVVTLTNAGADRVMPRYHAVGIAKAALQATVRYLAHELGGAGVLCNAVSFSLVASRGAVAAVGQAAVDATRSLLARKSTTGRATDAEDVAAMVRWLCSPDVRNMTGEVLTVDGGFSQRAF